MVHLDNSGAFFHLKILKINLGFWLCKEMTPDSGDSSLVSLGYAFPPATQGRLLPVLQGDEVGNSPLAEAWWNCEHLPGQDKGAERQWVHIRFFSLPPTKELSPEPDPESRFR